VKVKKGQQHVCMGSWILPLACLVYSLRLIPIDELFGSAGTISHFGERFRGGQYTLVSFLSAPRCLPCAAICKNGPPFPVVLDPLSGARPFGDGVGSAVRDLRYSSPSVWYRGKALA